MAAVIDQLPVSIPKESAMDVFTTPGAIDKYLGMVRSEIDGFSGDVNSKKGRDAIASVAYKVAKSKTYLDGVGKELTDAAKELPKKIDATRKHVRDTLDAWKDEVRKPLTDWEQAEESRIAGIKASLAELQGVVDDREERPSELFRERLAEVKGEQVTETRFGEYTPAAAELKHRAIAALEVSIAKAEKREADAAELARLRIESEARARQEREEQIAREAAERAKAEAERAARVAQEESARKAHHEQEAAQRRELELKLAAEKSEREKIEAQQRAERAEVEAKANAEREIRERQEREAKELAAREADKTHKAKINREAAYAFIARGIDEEIAKSVITLIAKRAIPNVQMNY